MNRLGLLCLLLIASIVIGTTIISPSYQEASSSIRSFFCLFHVLFVASLLYTGLINPGLVIATEDNQLSQSDSLESQNYSYCLICQCYRPPKSYHCSMCNVCIEGYDHHCAFMG